MQVRLRFGLVARDPLWFCESLVENVIFFEKTIVALGGCANACVSFFLPRCARGGCKQSEAAIARVYARSLLGGCANACLIFLARCARLGAAANGGKLRLREFTFARCAVGQLLKTLHFV